LKARNVAPWPASAAAAKTPISNRVPVEDADRLPALKIGEQLEREPAPGVERHAAHHVAERRAEEDRQKRAAAQKTVSQACRQSGEATWLRNSMAMPRRMSDQRTSMMAK